jgi:hypothetical protein
VVVNRLKIDNLEVKTDKKTTERKENLEKFTEYQTRDKKINKAEEKASKREKNLEKFTEYQTRDKENINNNESTRKINQEKVITYVKHLEKSLGNNSNNQELFGVQTNALGSKALDLLP